MNSGILERQEIHIPDTPEELLDELRMDLANRAAEKLGYDQLRTELYEDRAQKGKSHELASALHKLGIKPFTDESVEAYKKQKLESARTWRQKLEASQAFRNTVVALGVGGIIVLIIGLILIEANYRPWLMKRMIIGGGTALLVSWVAIKVREWLTEGIGRWEWVNDAIKRYGFPIPEAALEMALAIKETCPNAIIEVERLTFRDRNADPFLVASFYENGHMLEKFYVGVWDEPGFKAEFR